MRAGGTTAEAPPTPALWLVAALCACQPPPTPAAAADQPAFHRLTADQLNLALRDLFNDDNLPTISLPPDIAVDGFDNNALTRDATPYLVESLQRELSGLVAAEVADGGAWLTCVPGGGDDPLGCGRATLVQTQQRAWRRPSTPDEKVWIIDLFDDWYGQAGFDTAMQLSLQALLMSPDFLYLVERGDPETQQDGVRALTPWELASRLSFFLWDTMPDEQLFAAAQAGTLSNPLGLRSQARRMLAEDKAQAASLRFFRQWLGTGRIQDIDPDPSLFPDAPDEDAVGGRVADIKAAYLAEFDLFVQHAAWERGTLDALLTSRQTYVSPMTAGLYGVDFEASDEPTTTLIYPSGQAGEFFEVNIKPAKLDADQRAGVLSRGAFLASHSHALQPSPVLRGVFVRERLLCLDSVPPPAGMTALQEDASNGSTTNRERYAAQTADPTCAGCHAAIDGVGFAFEHYNALGAWRPTDNGAPVDASGHLLETDVDGPVDDAVHLMEVLAASRQTYDCVVTNLVRYGQHRTETGVDRSALSALQRRFWASGGDLPQLLEDFVSSYAFGTIRLDSSGGGA